MLNLKFIQDNPELVIEKLKKKNFDASGIVESITDLYVQKNKLQGQADQAKAEMNNFEGNWTFIPGRQKRRSRCGKRTDFGVKGKY